MKKLLLTTLGLLCLTGMNAQCWQQIDAGLEFTVGIKDNGTLWGWGTAYRGQLGVAESFYYASEPIQIGDDSDWAAVSAGGMHIIALKNDGTLWAWGGNDTGQLGNGDFTTDINPEPQQIGTDNDWIQISAGNTHSAAIKSDGTLWTWGGPINGVLGNGTDTESVLVPTQAGTDSDWMLVSASTDNTAAIKTNGTLWVTGLGIYGQIGNGSFDNTTEFTQAGTDNDWKQLSVGSFAVSAIKTNGTLWSWGKNNSGSLGNGTSDDSAVPVQISTDVWVKIARSERYFAGAVKSDGTLWTWGANFNGDIGDGTTDHKDVPTLIQAEEEWQVYTTSEFSVGLTADGELKVWGYNWSDQLGFNIEDDFLTSPLTVEQCTTAHTEEIAMQNFAIYPNPVSNMLYIDNNDSTIQLLTITDVTGKTILTQNVNVTQINVQHLPAGMYFIKIKTDTGASHQKFIKE